MLPGVPARNEAHRTPPPSELKLAEQVLAAVGDGSMGKDGVSVHLLIHSHVFTMSLPAYAQYDPLTPYAVPLGISTDDMTTWVMVVAAWAGRRRSALRALFRLGLIEVGPDCALDHVSVGGCDGRMVTITRRIRTRARFPNRPEPLTA
jgi:hypothetical protein